MALLRAADGVELAQVLDADGDVGHGVNECPQTSLAACRSSV